MTLLPRDVLIVAACVVGLVAAFAAGNAWSERFLRRWCRTQGFELVSWTGANFLQGRPRSDNQYAYRIEVRDRDGFIREGTLIHGAYWHPFSRKVTVEWD